MIVFVNSKEYDVASDANLTSLLELLGMTQKRVAVEVNTQLVTKSEWTRYKLKDKDRVEIVSFVGGG